MYPPAPSLRQKLREWTARYALGELVGTLLAFSAFWLVRAGTGSLALAAICGTIGENLGFYGMILGRDARRDWQSSPPALVVWRRLWLTAARLGRRAVIEFGVAELIDSFAVRPALYYVLPRIFDAHLGLALLAAKVCGDLCFYGLAILGYEAHKRLFPTVHASLMEVQE